jgi:biopolymer transport protein ExbD
MARRKHRRPSFETKIDMTSMIDLTFLLVIFFVLTSSFTTLNLEDVTLPVALSAREQEKPPEGVIIINVKKTSDATREGKIVFDGTDQTPESLENALKNEVLVHAEQYGPEIHEGQRLSKLEVLVRADEGVQSKYIRDVFMACQKQGLYRLKISSLQP